MQQQKIQKNKPKQTFMKAQVQTKAYWMQNIFSCLLKPPQSNWHKNKDGAYQSLEATVWKDWCPETAIKVF